MKEHEENPKGFEELHSKFTVANISGDSIRWPEFNTTEGRIRSCFALPACDLTKALKRPLHSICLTLKYHNFHITVSLLQNII